METLKHVCRVCGTMSDAGIFFGDGTYTCPRHSLRCGLCDNLMGTDEVKDWRCPNCGCLLRADGRLARGE